MVELQSFADFGKYENFTLGAIHIVRTEKRRILDHPPYTQMHGYVFQDIWTSTVEYSCRLEKVTTNMVWLFICDVTFMQFSLKETFELRACISRVLSRIVKIVTWITSHHESHTQSKNVREKRDLIYRERMCCVKDGRYINDLHTRSTFFSIFFGFRCIEFRMGSWESLTWIWETYLKICEWFQQNFNFFII